MRVAIRPYGHPLSLPLYLGIPQQALLGDGNIHHCPKGMIVPSVQFLLKDVREAMIEEVLLLVSVHMDASILR